MSSECKDCEDHFCCIYLGQRTCPKHSRRQGCFCGPYQLHQIEAISPAVYCQRCDFLSECYNYRHIGRFASRNSYVLEKFCIEHSPTPDFPHREPTSFDVQIPVILQTPNYKKILHNVDSRKEADMLEEGAAANQLENREGTIPGLSQDTSMSSELSEPAGGSSEGVPAVEIPQGTRRGRRGQRGSGNGRSEFQLSAESIVGTRSASHACYLSMQRRKRNHRK